MDMRSEIKKLARIEDGQYPFLSLYLNTKWDDEQQRERIRLFTKNQLKKGYDQFKGRDRENWRKVFTEDQQRIEKYGMATLGLNGTLEALNQGQVYTLYLLTSFSLRGGKCSRCGSLNLVSSIGDSSIPCNLCKGETKTVDLGEEMMRSTLRQDGEVKWIEENSILKENDGVGASLRFSSSR
jgi:hypothetical protein